jgi:hypothetical protein
MMDDSRYILDDLLASWHRWASGFSALGSHTVAPMFQGFSTSRQWDAVNDVVDAEINSDQMAALDFHISELEPIHRTAIGIQARNLVTGRSVWNSARLPADIQERCLCLAAARNNLTTRLVKAGIM